MSQVLPELSHATIQSAAETWNSVPIFRDPKWAIYPYQQNCSMILHVIFILWIKSLIWFETMHFCCCNHSRNWHPHIEFNEFHISFHALCSHARTVFHVWCSFPYSLANSRAQKVIFLNHYLLHWYSKIHWSWTLKINDLHQLIRSCCYYGLYLYCTHMQYV